MSDRSGRHFPPIPGSSNVPERARRAIDRATVDRRGPAFAALSGEALRRPRTVSATARPVRVCPSSGTGAREAAPVNARSPGDRILTAEAGRASKAVCRVRHETATGATTRISAARAAADG